MQEPIVVVITGPAAAGKTSLGHRISREFGLPFFNKDGFKERMCEIVSESVRYDQITRERSQELSRLSIACLEIVMERMLESGQSLIVEANFNSALVTPRIAALKERRPFHLVQVVLYAEGATLLERFVLRETVDRHPGHQGLKHLPELRESLLRADATPIAVTGDLLRFDTTEFDRVDYAPLWSLLTQRLGRSGR